MKKKLKIWQVTGLLLGFLCVLYWLLLNITYGSVPFSIMFLLVGLCLFLFCLGTWYWQISIWNMLPRKLAIFLSGILFLCTAIFIGVEARILWYGHTSSSSYGDTIVVLGAGLLHGDQISASLKFRLDKALEIHKKTPDSMLVVSGGQGEDETVSEAFAMKRYLVANGINEEQILIEDRSSNTNENFQFSKAIMEENGISSLHISLITNGFHMHRASYLGSLYGFEIERFPAKGLWSLEICSYTREFFGTMRAYILQY